MKAGNMPEKYPVCPETLYNSNNIFKAVMPEDYDGTKVERYRADL